LLAWREITGLSRHGGGILAWRNATGASPWRAKSRLAGDEGMFAMASYHSAWRNDPKQTTGLRTFPPQILFFIMLSPKYD